MMNRRSVILPQTTFTNPTVTKEPKVSKTYTTERQFVLGTRKPPVVIEKADKFPDPDRKGKKLTLYAQAGSYAMLVYDNNEILFRTRTRNPDGPPNDDYKTLAAMPMEAIVPAPAAGFLLCLRDRGFIFLNNFVQGIEIPVNASVSLTSFHWIMPSNQEMRCLFGSMKGHIYQLSIFQKSQNVPTQILYEDPNNIPISSISTIQSNGVTYLFAATYQNLKILKWPSFNEPLVEDKTILTTSKTNRLIPSFVCSNQTHVSWLSYDDLRIYSYNEITSNPASCALLGFDVLSKLFNIENSLAILVNSSNPMIMSKYYTIIMGPSSLIGFALQPTILGDPNPMNFKIVVGFRYPLNSAYPKISLNYDRQLNKIHVATSKALFDIDLNSEQKPSDIRPIKEVKADLIREKKTSKDVPACEVLSSIIENKDYRDAVQMLKEHLTRVIAKYQSTQEPSKSPQVGDGKSRRVSTQAQIQIPREKIEQLCEEFFIYELLVIYASDNNKPEMFKPKVFVDDEHFDIFAALSKMLQLRAFSPVYNQIKDESVTSTAKNSPLLVRMLLEDNKITEAIDKILEFRPQGTEKLSTIVFKYRDILKKQHFYDYEHLRKPGLRTFVLSILPFIAGDLPSDTAFALLNNELQSLQPKQIDLLLWSLTTADNANKYDEAVSETIKSKYDLNKGLLSNPFTSMQHCLKAHMYRTASQIAVNCGLYKEAVLAALKIDKNYAKRIIKHSPKAMQVELCRIANIEMESEGYENTRISSKAMATKELENMERKYEILNTKFKESEQFLLTLQDWNYDESTPSTECSVCHCGLTRQTGYAFQCGHSFHEACLINAFELCLVDTADKDKIFNFKKYQSTVDKEWTESKMTEECPLCGVISVNSIRGRPVDETPVWPTDFDSICALHKK